MYEVKMSCEHFNDIYIIIGNNHDIIKNKKSSIVGNIF